MHVPLKGESFRRLNWFYTDAMPSQSSRPAFAPPWSGLRRP